jgi:hypothetical protein
MDQLQIQLDGDRTCYAPGATLKVVAAWNLTQPAEALELRLSWFTQGRTTAETAMIETRRIDKPAVEGQQQFEITAPGFPFSFRGVLFEISWALDLISFPTESVVRQLIVVAPNAETVVAPGAVATPPPLPLPRAA